MSSKVFSVKNTCQSIVQFLDTPTQLRCLRVNRATRGHVEEFQTRVRPEQAKKIADLFTDEIVQAVGGRERLLAAPVLDLTGSSWLSANLHSGCFKGQFAIGMQGTLPFLAYKIHYLVDGCCGWGVAKRSVGILTQSWTASLFHSGDIALGANPDSVEQLQRFFRGEGVLRNLRVEDVEGSVCWCSCSEFCSILNLLTSGLNAWPTHRLYKLVLGS